MPGRVLVVDDESAIREAIRTTLEYEGYEVDEARSGQDALDMVGQGAWDVLLLDIKMQTPLSDILLQYRDGRLISLHQTRQPG